MSLYSVEWNPGAEDDLAAAWLQAPIPNDVAAAQVEVDRLLARDPIGNGAHLSEGLYRLIVPPLAVTYSVDTANKIVEVSKAWHVA